MTVMNFTILKSQLLKIFPNVLIIFVICFVTNHHKTLFWLDLFSILSPKLCICIFLTVLQSVQILLQLYLHLVNSSTTCSDPAAN